MGKRGYFGKPAMFSDGPKGKYRQEYDVFFGEEAVDLGVRMIIDGQQGQKATRTFIANRAGFGSLKEAVLARGFKWEGEP